MAYVPVNGHYLDPGSCQITVHWDKAEPFRVVCNCRDFEDASTALDNLLRDPREVMDGRLKFQVLDHTGKVIGTRLYAWRLADHDEEALACERTRKALGISPDWDRGLLKGWAVMALLLMARILALTFQAAKSVFLAVTYAGVLAMITLVPLVLLFDAVSYLVSLFR